MKTTTIIIVVIIYLIGIVFSIGRRNAIENEFVDKHFYDHVDREKSQFPRWLSPVLSWFGYLIVHSAASIVKIKTKSHLAKAKKRS